MIEAEDGLLAIGKAIGQLLNDDLPQFKDKVMSDNDRDTVIIILDCSGEEVGVIGSKLIDAAQSAVGKSGWKVGPYMQADEHGAQAICITRFDMAESERPLDQLRELVCAAITAELIAAETEVPISLAIRPGEVLTVAATCDLRAIAEHYQGKLGSAEGVEGAEWLFNEFNSEEYGVFWAVLDSGDGFTLTYIGGH